VELVSVVCLASVCMDSAFTALRQWDRDCRIRRRHYAGWLPSADDVVFASASVSISCRKCWLYIPWKSSFG